MDRGADEEESLSKFASRIVDSFHEMLIKGIKGGTPPLHVGSTFKSPFTTKVHLVAWQEGDRVWIVTADCRFGSFGPLGDPFWEYTEYTRANPELLQKNPDWKVGDVVTRGQRYYRGKVVAVGNRCVLLECLNTGNIQPDSNENMAKYYKRERRNGTAQSW
jgi:hypothetical protein